MESESEGRESRAGSVCLRVCSAEGCFGANIYIFVLVLGTGGISGTELLTGLHGLQMCVRLSLSVSVCECV